MKLNLFTTLMALIRFQFSKPSKVALLAILTPFLAATPSYSQDIGELINGTLSHHPDLRSAQQDIRSARELQVQARANYLPTISISAGLSTSQRDARLNDGTEFDEGTSPEFARVTVEQPLFTNGLRNSLSQSARIQTEIVVAEYQALELSLAANIVDLFHDAVLAEATVRNEIEFEQLVYNQLLAAQARFERGVGTRTEIFQIQAKLAEARARLEVAQLETSSYRNQIELLSGVSPYENLELPIIEVSDFDTDQYVRDAIRFSPSLRSADLNTRLERISALSARQRHGPQISLQLEGSRSDNQTPVVEEDNELSASLVFSMPLYDGGRTRSQVRQSLNSQRSSEHRARGVRLTLESEIELLILRMRSAQQELDAQRVRQSTSEEVLTGIQAGLDAGIWSVQDMLEATENVVFARQAVIDAEVRHSRALAQLMLITGNLDKL